MGHGVVVVVVVLPGLCDEPKCQSQGPDPKNAWEIFGLFVAGKTLPKMPWLIEGHWQIQAWQRIERIGLMKPWRRRKIRLAQCKKKKWPLGRK